MSPGPALHRLLFFSDFNLYPFGVINHTTMTTSIMAFLSPLSLPSQALSLTVLLGTLMTWEVKSRTRSPWLDAVALWTRGLPPREPRCHEGQAFRPSQNKRWT